MKYLLVFVFVLSTACLKAQLKIDTTISSQALIDKILIGQGVRVGNIKHITDSKAIAYYQCKPNKIGIKSGILLCTGNASGAAGPNTSPGYTSFLTQNSKKWKGDKDLNRLSKGGKTMDVSEIEFDFVPMNNTVSFEYVFGSEEYTEYVGSQFNDVFGFFVSGPNMPKKNVALLPQSKKFVAINNINQKTVKDLFIDNDPFVNMTLFKNVKWKPKISLWKKMKSALFGKKTMQGDSVLFYADKLKKASLDENLLETFQYDGFTKKMRVTFFVTPYQKYHIKIAIGDVGDNAFDSGVFMEEKSFISVKDTTQPKFVEYADKSASFNFDSLFGMKKKVQALVEEKEDKEDFERTSIYFGSESFAIPDSCKKMLDALAAQMLKLKERKFILTGFADNTGNKSKNKALSEKRALTVMYYLTALGVERSRLTYIGLSSDSPIGDNKTPEGRAQNRRVEIDVSEEE